MANLTQAVNVLQSLLLTEGDKLVKTPTYHVFDMFKTHQDAELLYSYIDNTQINGLSEVSQSVSQDKDGKIIMTFANASLDEDFEIDCAIVGAKPKTAEARILSGYVRAYNDFGNPDKLKPVEHTAEITENGLKFTLPKCAVVSVVLS